MKKRKKLNDNQINLLFDFVKLWRKYINKEDMSYYDQKLIEIIEEYDYLIDYRKEWKKRSD